MGRDATHAGVESQTGGSAVNAAVSGAAGPGMGERKNARACAREHIPPHKRSRGRTGTEGTAQPRQRRRANQPNGVKSKPGSRQYRALRCLGRKQQRSVIYGFVLFIYGFVLFRPDAMKSDFLHGARRTRGWNLSHIVIVNKTSLSFSLSLSLSLSTKLLSHSLSLSQSIA